MAPVAARREQKRLRQTGHYEGKHHANGDQPEIADREDPPSGDKCGPGVSFDAETLEALDLGCSHRVQIGADGIQLWESIETDKQDQNGRE